MRPDRETQVPVGVAEGLKHDSCINCDQLVLIEKGRLTNYVGFVPPARLRVLRQGAARGTRRGVAPATAGG